MRPPGCAPNAMWADPRESLRARAATTPASSRGSGNDCKAESTSTSGSADQLDKAGQTILQMLHRAAGVAEENSRHALETAQKLSHQLRAAEDRIAELEAESLLIRTEPSGPSSGSIASTRRLKIDFSGRMTGAAEPLNARRRVDRIWLDQLCAGSANCVPVVIERR
jgi:hypothetical protein